MAGVCSGGLQGADDIEFGTIAAEHSQNGSQMLAENINGEFSRTERDFSKFGTHYEVPESLFSQNGQNQITVEYGNMTESLKGRVSSEGEVQCDMLGVMKKNNNGKQEPAEYVNAVISQANDLSQGNAYESLEKLQSQRIGDKEYNEIIAESDGYLAAKDLLSNKDKIYEELGVIGGNPNKSPSLKGNEGTTSTNLHEETKPASRLSATEPQNCGGHNSDYDNSTLVQKNMYANIKHMGGNGEEDDYAKPNLTAATPLEASNFPGVNDKGHPTVLLRENKIYASIETKIWKDFGSWTGCKRSCQNKRRCLHSDNMEGESVCESNLLCPSLITLSSPSNPISYLELFVWLTSILLSFFSCCSFNDSIGRWNLSQSCFCTRDFFAAFLLIVVAFGRIQRPFFSKYGPFVCLKCFFQSLFLFLAFQLQ